MCVVNHQLEARLSVVEHPFNNRTCVASHLLVDLQSDEAPLLVVVIPLHEALRWVEDLHLEC